MKNLKSSEIREVFLKFFESRNHRVVSSSPLIPPDDPTLLFTTAGMVQFKPYFLREKTPEYTRATSVQKCLRAGGKASDLENVGKTPRHHTFFEMLGNFSFGDYFKKEAIEYAWDFVTNVVGIEKELLWVSIYKDDEEAFEIWNKRIGIQSDRIIRLGEKDNFWGPPGDEGPCGPCSEIYIDLREIWGYDKTTCKTPEDCDGFLEFWNLVFMQFHQDRTGKRTELEYKGIDTGMGLERLAMILQNKKSVYETDVFEPIINKIVLETQKKYEGDNTIPINVLADHSRAITFVGAEGVYPSNEGRGYVIRRILRRALRYANKIGINEPIIHKIIDGVVASMGDAYPEIVSKKDNIKKVIKIEEERYFSNIAKGIEYLSELIQKIKEQKRTILPGAEVFKLYDSMGVPLDLIEDVCKDEGLSVDWNNFNELMEEQKQRGRMSWKKEEVVFDFNIITKGETSTKYVGDEYYEYESRVKKILLKEGENLVESEVLNEGNLGIVITEETPFYGEGGGQIGDIGLITADENTGLVLDTKKENDVYLHIVRPEKGEIKKNSKVKMIVDINRKKNIAKHHTATHILHASLRKVLGTHVAQAGSLVEPNRLRFDFSHYSSLTDDEIRNIEEEANEIIFKDVEVIKTFMPREEAIKSGALAFFGDKYGDIVRVVSISNFSKELCGGTHVNRTGEIGIIKITDERAIASGVRRLEAVAGKSALDEFRKYSLILEELSRKLGVDFDNIPVKVDSILKKLKELEKSRSKASRQVSVDEIVSDVEDIGNIKVVFKVFSDVDTNSLGRLVDSVRDRINNVVVFLASEGDKGINFVAGTNVSGLNIHKVLETLKSEGVKGGGRSDFVRGAIDKGRDLLTIKDLFISQLKTIY
ncbi:MAG: alanine--tRNA ligase [Spirochaetia bacterium]|nr:alanine--tRNA ligase [Spirochaetota bacterium]MDW8112192.1 alanine--tRNA ligase [Spirochaetia bacterium]